jgi:hypothetical protein
MGGCAVDTNSRYYPATSTARSGRPRAAGGLYGGGGGGAPNPANVGVGGPGAVRIIWPGNTRSFPSTNAGTV